MTRRTGICERVRADVREGEAAGAAVVGVKLATGQSGTLDTVDELAGRIHGDTQRASEVTDPQAAVTRLLDEVQRLKERQRQAMVLFQPGVDPVPEWLRELRG